MSEITDANEKILEGNTQPTEEIVNSNQEDTSTEQLYAVIVGAFKDEKLAKQFQEFLNKTKIPSFIIPLC